mmetsp:Transcript_1486/g.4130  ORF Transcript_1486/g.4130 Transcript_1486/m.4130 type:complete len:315 (-) Transcript_1486:501-1445(-)
MNPYIGHVFRTPDDRQPLVDQSPIDLGGVVALDVGPHQRRPLFWFDEEPIQVRKSRRPTLLHVRQYQQYRQNSRTRRLPIVVDAIIVMDPVRILRVLVVPDQFGRLEVIGRDTDDLRDPLHDSSVQGRMHLFAPIPRTAHGAGRRSSGTLLRRIARTEFGLVHRRFHPSDPVPYAHESLDLLVRQKILEPDQVRIVLPGGALLGRRRRFRQKHRRVLVPLSPPDLPEHFIDRTLLERGLLVRMSLPRASMKHLGAIAHPARQRAGVQHEHDLIRTHSRRRPLGAQTEGVLAPFTYVGRRIGFEEVSLGIFVHLP